MTTINIIPTCIANVSNTLFFKDYHDASAMFSEVLKNGKIGDRRAAEIRCSEHGFCIAIFDKLTHSTTGFLRK